MAKKFAEYKGLNLTEINKQVLEQWKKGDVFRHPKNTSYTPTNHKRHFQPL